MRQVGGTLRGSSDIIPQLLRKMESYKGLSASRWSGIRPRRDAFKSVSRDSWTGPENREVVTIGKRKGDKRKK